MTDNATSPQSRATTEGRNDLLGGGRLMLTRDTDTAQQPALVAASPRDRRAVARPVLVATRGRVEFAVRCPACREWHRHTSLGPKRGPCGARYEVRPRRGHIGRAA